MSKHKIVMNHYESELILICNAVKSNFSESDQSFADQMNPNESSFFEAKHLGKFIIHVHHCHLVLI